MRLLGTAFISLSVVVCACTDEVDPWPGAERTTLTHATGFSIQLPRDIYRVYRTDKGFEIRPIGAERMRAPTEISVRVESETVVPGDWPESREVAGHDVHYRVTHEEGGSGGDLYTFEAWIPLKGSHVRLTEQIQAETMRPPRFAEAWAIAASISW
jgi:hypothetical protein